MLRTVLIFDGTFSGLLTTIFETYTNKYENVVPQEENSMQLAFDANYIHVQTDDEKADRVRNGLIKKAGHSAYEKAYLAFLRPEKEKLLLIFNFIKLCFSMGEKASEYFTNETIISITRMVGAVSHEVQILSGFIRLKLVNDNLYYAQITPDSDVLELLAPHFADRYQDQRIALHDTRRQKAALCADGVWEILSHANIVVPQISQSEDQLISQWKTYFRSIDNPRRRNLSVQRRLMPKRYWKNITEMEK